MRKGEEETEKLVRQAQEEAKKINAMSKAEGAR